MPKFTTAKEKEQQEDTIKRPQQNGYFFFFSIKACVKKKSDIEYFSEFSVQKYANKLIKRKTAANIF